MQHQRFCFCLDLKDDSTSIESYRAWHAPGGPPAAVNRAIRAAGVDLLEIYLTGNRLFMIMEAAPEFSLAAKAAADTTDLEVQAWEKLMWEFQQPLSWAKQGEKWIAATRVYSLYEQP